MGIIKNYQASKGTCKVTFSYPVNAAEGVKSIQVLGDFNNWDGKVAPKMKKGKEEFNTVIELAVGQKYEFKYLLDNQTWDNDFAADNYITSPFGGTTNSVLILDAVSATKSIAKPSSTLSSKKTTVKAEVKPVAKTAAPKTKKVVAKKAPVVKAATKTNASAKSAKVSAATSTTGKAKK